MNLTQNEAAGLLRAEAARRGSGTRERCPPAAQLTAMFTSIAEGVDRFGIADHLSQCGDCVREVDALVVLFRGRRDVETAPLSRESRPPRGLFSRLVAAVRRRDARGDAVNESVERALRSFRGAIRGAADRIRVGMSTVDGDTIGNQASAAAASSVPAGSSPELAARSAIRVAFEVAADRLLDANRSAPRPSPAPLADPDEPSTRLAGAVSGLTDRRRQVVILHFVGLRIPEIAITLALSDDQARSLLLRGLRDLGHDLSGRGIILE
ncbi:MAG: hypothetical protein HY292_03940 [Planctomycetes bacterium]|nr:hypothetical protein [Planctomycetota bacterium]